MGITNGPNEKFVVINGPNSALALPPKVLVALGEFAPPNSQTHLPLATAVV